MRSPATLKMASQSPVVKKLELAYPDTSPALAAPELNGLIQRVSDHLEPHRQLLIAERNSKLTSATEQYAHLKDTEAHYVQSCATYLETEEDLRKAREAVEAAKKREAESEEKVLIAKRTMSGFTRDAKRRRITLYNAVYGLEETDERLVKLSAFFYGGTKDMQSPLLGTKVASQDGMVNISNTLRRSRASSSASSPRAPTPLSIIDSNSITATNRPSRKTYASWLTTSLGPIVISIPVDPYDLTAEDVKRIKAAGTLGVQEWLRLSFVSSPSSRILSSQLWTMCTEFFGRTSNAEDKTFGFMNDVTAVFPDVVSATAKDVKGARLEVVAGLRRREKDDPAPFV